MANEEHLSVLRKGCFAWNEWRERNLEVYPDLSYADLTEANLGDVNFAGVNLAATSLARTNLSGANLNGVTFQATDLAEANLHDARLGYAVFADVDLRFVSGLETVIHTGPSTIGIDTLYLSKGKIPEVF